MVVKKRKKSLRHGGRDGKGSGKRNRGAGNRGGRGNAGMGKRAGHKKLKAIKLGIKFGVDGFTSVKQKHDLKPDSINIGKLEKLLVKLRGTNLINEGKEGIEINLTKLGFGKLTGSGQVKNKWIITVRKASEKAKAKIEEAGGKIIEG